jgi:hypothetical protein
VAVTGMQQMEPNEVTDKYKKTLGENLQGGGSRDKAEPP